MPHIRHPVSSPLSRMFTFDWLGLALKKTIRIHFLDLLLWWLDKKSKNIFRPNGGFEKWWYFPMGFAKNHLKNKHKIWLNSQIPSLKLTALLPFFKKDAWKSTFPFRPDLFSGSMLNLQGCTFGTGKPILNLKTWSSWRKSKSMMATLFFSKNVNQNSNDPDQCVSFLESLTPRFRCFFCVLTKTLFGSTQMLSFSKKFPSYAKLSEHPDSLM